MSESIEDIGQRVDAYSRWLRDRHSPALAFRSAEENAEFLLPHLHPGMSLLDAGCGPGSITLGLARSVAPGHVVGFDLDSRAIDQARALAAKDGVSNVEFVEASIYATGFPDATFDVVFAHAVLQHLAEPGKAVMELLRVAKQGGLVALVDADHGVSALWPELPALLAANALVERLRVSADTSPRVGRELGRLLIEAGCVDTWHRTRASEPLTVDTARRTGQWQAAYFRAPQFRARVVENGHANIEELDAMATAWEAWGAVPGALWARPWCEALARKPA